MAQTPFQYNGQTFSIDEQGTIRNNMGVQVSDASNVGLAQAASAAVSGRPAPVAAPVDPAAAVPATSPAATPGGLSSNFSVHQTGTTSMVPPTTAAPVLPATAPRVGANSDTEDRTQRDKLQKQLDDLNKTIDPAAGPTNAQSTAMNGLNTRITSLTEQIAKAEAVKDKPATVLRSTGGTTEPFNIIDNGDGTVTATPNANYTGQVQPQVVEHGNHTLVITPPTKDELAKDPTAAAHVTVAYTDTDAQALANRQTGVSEANAATAAAAAATQDFAARSQADLATRVSNGEDAASIRAEQSQKLTELHDAWVRADGDRRAAQQALDSYNTDRHAQAQESLTSQQIQATSAAQAAQDATTRYGYDKSAATSKYATDTAATTSKYATDTAATTAKLQVGAQFLQNALTNLAAINKDLPPGSDLAGKALPGLLAYGQQFLAGFAGSPAAAAAAPSNTPATNAPTMIDPTKDLSTQVGVAPPAAASPDPLAAPLGRVPESSADSAARQLLPPPAASPAGGLDWLFNSAASPIATPGNTIVTPGATAGAANMATSDAMAAQNTAAHNANMSPDGTPWAHPNDVARIFGRGGPA